MKKDILGTRAFYKPFHYPWAYEMWLRSEQSHWIHTHEVPMHEDIKDWKNKLTDKEKEFVTSIFRFFTQGDIDVSEGYVEKYLQLIKHPELRMMLLSFAGRETVHIAAYSHLIESLDMPDSIYKAFLDYAVMRDKHEYIFTKHDDLDEEKKFALDIAIFSALTEGVQLFSSFIMLLNFVRHGKMKAMGQIVSWSLLDESNHVEGMTKVFRTYIKERPHLWDDDLKQRIYSAAEKMVELEDAFIDLCYEMGETENLTSDGVKKYIRHIADRRLIGLGLKGIFKVKKNPLPWVEPLINAPTHANFFETRATDYSKGANQGSWQDVWA